MNIKTLIFSLLAIAFFLWRPQLTHAYSTNMSASMVIGQSDFSTSSSGTTSQKLSGPQDMIIVNNKMIVADQANHRVLIWNSVPTSSGTPADVVLGQPNLTSGTANNGGVSAHSFNAPTSVTSDGTRLMVTDRGSNRVLIWNTIPTTNQADADVVVGQTSMSVGGSAFAGCARLNQPETVFTDGQRLFVADSSNGRVLIWNTIPTTSGTAANLVLGQANCSTPVFNAASSTTMGYIHAVYYNSGKLFVSDESFSRIMVWNSLPTTNNAPADFVIGQATFSGGSSNQGGSVGPNTFSAPNNMVISNGRLFVADQSNHRVLIWNKIPTANNAYADIVLGQPDFTTRTAHNGGVTASSLNNPVHVYVYQDKLYVSDQLGHRYLVFDNVVKTPGITLSSHPENAENNKLRMTGTAKVDSPYTLTSVEYAVNDGSFSSASADDGQFNTASEGFVVTFDPSANQAKDSDGKTIDGYTLQIKATSNNVDITDHAFFFSPFVLQSPANEEVVSSEPAFSFSVNKQRQKLKENLDHYAVQVRNRSTDQGWQTLVDQIPVDFAGHKDDLENLQRGTWGSLNVLDGVYETSLFSATYSDSGSSIVVRPKGAALAGSYEWKVLAVDKSGRSQETGARNAVFAGATGSVTPGFPLAILNISGLGNPNISSYNLAGIKASYRTSASAPIFYGIAWSGATVKLQLTQNNCTANCVQEFSTTANALSRFGINLPAKTLASGSTYTVRLFSSYNDFYTELPTFQLKVGASSK